ncbi:copper resistance CopC/CopD family protein [Ornithinimicrobium cryptoxanthini]|uniref:Copper resistance protein CopC/CopD n=1 Tax=Ornithinimicrobium cryptoxanthini TaxID=2934161 RepID=A0ABY4YI66_9MICO|nr:copper resistance protein CopC [Ornithinimicrobium cryptoxanthini]USQ76456.1 copper resistance protein CopC/CopD [Ornithinimicrobium cryptoxanthini]
MTTLLRVGTRLVILLALIVIPMAALAGPAQAHASLVSSDPVADTLYDVGPEAVTLEFNEPVEVDLGGVRVFGPSGERVDDATERAGDSLVVRAGVDTAATGTYTVAWTVVSADSHVLSGAFVFHVGARSGAVDIDRSDPAALVAARWLARWALLAGTTVLGGLVLFRAAAPWAGLDSARAGRLAQLAAGALLVGAAAKLFVHVTDASARPLLEVAALLGDAVLGTRAGLLDGARVLAGVLAVIAVVRWRSRYAVPLAGAAVLTTIVTLGFSGHAWTSPAPAVSVAADIVHHGAAAVWIGGVAALALVLAPSEGGAQEDVARAVRRFSVLALWSIVVVTVTGIVSALLQSGLAPGTLLSTRYGTTLIVKLVLVAAVVGLGWWQRSRLLETVTRSGRLFRTARGELVVATVILATTALLVDTVPARESLEPQPFQSSATDEGGTVSVLVTPSRSGDNAIHLTFFDRVGSPRGIDAASATVVQGDLPPRSIELEPLAGSHWVAPLVSLPAGGTWTLNVETLGSSEQTSFSVEIDVAERATT